MEIDLHRDDGLVHVITTGVSYIDKMLWVSSYFGVCRYDARNWGGFFSKEGGPPNEFTNNVRARSANAAWFCTDEGLGVMAKGGLGHRQARDFHTCTIFMRE